MCRKNGNDKTNISADICLFGEQTTGRHGQLAVFWSQLAAKLAASCYYVLFYYIDNVDISYCPKSRTYIANMVIETK